MVIGGVSKSLLYSSDSQENPISNTVFMLMLTIVWAKYLRYPFLLFSSFLEASHIISDK